AGRPCPARGLDAAKGLGDTSLSIGEPIDERCIRNGPKWCVEVRFDRNARLHGIQFGAIPDGTVVVPIFGRGAQSDPRTRYALERPTPQTSDLRSGRVGAV